MFPTQFKFHKNSNGALHQNTSKSKWPFKLILLTILSQLISTCEALGVLNSLNTANNVQSIVSKLSPFHSLEPDAFLDPPEFIRSRRFVPEVHKVITKDNYVLTVHRIINPLVPVHLRPKLKPVLLQHGLFTSSYNFIIASDLNNDRPRFDKRDLRRTKPLYVYTPELPFSWQRLLQSFNDLTFAKLGLTQSSDHYLAPHVSDSLAFEMANQGYDVWMGNARGSTYSLNHTQYDYRHDWRFWDFSFHEVGLFDLPAIINHILLHRPERKSLAYVGHSQGNLAMFILQSFHPEWAQKVKPFVALAPIAFIPDVYFGITRLWVNLVSPVISLKRMNELVKGQILPKDHRTEQALDLICIPKWTTFACNAALTLILGDSFKRTNSSRIPVIAHHIPEGTSVLNVLHFGQLVGSGEFRAFDFGPRENLRRYGSQVNPYYPIKNVKSPDIAFVVGRTDTLSTMSNVAITRSMLSVPLMDDHVVPELTWGHADYMYAIGAGRLANAHIIGLCDRYRLVA